MSQPYRSLEAEFHDAFWAADDGHSELSLMADFLASHPGESLEIGSGSGRLMLPLRQQGFALEGLELSPDMRAIATQQAEKLGLEAMIHAGDMSTWQPPKRYAALLVPAFTLQLATDPAATLRHWHDWLLPGGGLYLTTFIPYAELLGEIPENEWYIDHQATLTDGRCALLETRHRIDSAKRQLAREHRYSIKQQPDANHNCCQQLTWFEPRELSELLKSAGFIVERHFLDFDPDFSLPEPESDEFDGIVTHLARSKQNADD